MQLFAITTTFFPRLSFKPITLHFSLSKNYFFPKFSLIKYTLSHSTNSYLNLCDICNFLFNSVKDFLTHTLLSSYQKRTRDMIMGLDEAETASPPQPQPKPNSSPPPLGETRPAFHKPKPKLILENMERVYGPEEDYYILVPKKVLPEL